MGQCLCTDPYPRTKADEATSRHPPPSAAGSPPDDNRHGNSNKSCTRPWSGHCGDLSLRRKVPPSEDELKLRHIQNELSGLRELVVEEHRDVHDHRHGLQHSCTAPPLFPPPRRPSHLPPRPTRRHYNLSPESTRRAAVHGLRLPGEAQPMSVRRCTYRHRYTPHWPSQLVLEELRADPQRPKASCKASHSTLLHHHLRLPLCLRLVVSARHGLGISRRSPWIKVRTQFRPRVRIQTRTFFHMGKSAKNPLPSFIRRTNVR